MRQLDPAKHTPGNLVFAKLKGYPWWPARIENEQNVPAKVLQQKSRTKGPLWTVLFFGTGDYGFVGSDNIRSFEKEDVERDLKDKKFKSKDLEHAVRQALDPTYLEDDKKDTSNKSYKTGAPSTKKSVQTKTSVKRKLDKAHQDPPRKRSTRKSTKDPDESTDEKIKKQKPVIIEKAAENHCRESPSLSPTTPRKPDEVHPTDKLLVQEDCKPQDSNVDPADTIDKTAFKKVYHARHRLQKLVYDKKAGEIPKEAYPRIASIIQEVEQLPMTYTLLKETKIGKVLKAACSYSYENDTDHNINDKCQQILKTWKSLFLNSNPSNTSPHPGHGQPGLTPENRQTVMFKDSVENPHITSQQQLTTAKEGVLVTYTSPKANRQVQNTTPPKVDYNEKKQTKKMALLEQVIKKIDK
ncbi:hypothetical protein BDF14DRAFT_1779847 [Spinellus fusiger]|nr:hypothetical protein BDF14DRAFT_1779847 [Spinellus fusiger]